MIFKTFLHYPTLNNEGCYHNLGREGIGPDLVEVHYRTIHQNAASRTCHDVVLGYRCVLGVQMEGIGYLVEVVGIAGFDMVALHTDLAEDTGCSEEEDIAAGADCTNHVRPGTRLAVEDHLVRHTVQEAEHDQSKGCRDLVCCHMVGLTHNLAVHVAVVDLVEERHNLVVETGYSLEFVADYGFVVVVVLDSSMSYEIAEILDHAAEKSSCRMSYQCHLVGRKLVAQRLSSRLGCCLLASSQTDYQSSVADDAEFILDSVTGI